MISLVKFDTGAAAGSAGSATSTAYSTHISGEILAVYVKYQGSPPAGTTDFTLSDETDPSSENIISITDAATDIKIYPRRVLELNDGTDITYDGTNEVYGKYIVHGRLEAKIDDANAADYCDVYVWYRML
jgi:hypothetical protein